MKNTIKYLSILLAVFALSFTACKDDDCGPDPKDGKDCDTELIFKAHAFCSGDWFQTTTGEYLEVYGYDASGLKDGDRVRFGYEDYNNGHLIECKAISHFEKWLIDNGHSYKIVKVREECKKDKVVGCDEELECVDLGMCGGVWFKDAHGAHLEVYGYPNRNTLKVGDKVKFGYDDYAHNGITCQALTQWEVNFYDTRQPYKVVKARKECFGSGEEETGECNTKVTYYKRDFCSGELFKTEDGKLLRIFGFHLMDIELKEGDVLTIGYEPIVLENDCQYIRQPDEIGEPVELTCSNKIE